MNVVRCLLFYRHHLAHLAHALNNLNNSLSSYPILIDCLLSSVNSMNDLASKHSNLMTITKIGESYLKNNPGRSNNSFDLPPGGHDIFAIVITDSTSSISSNDKGKSLYTTGVHARGEIDM